MKFIYENSDVFYVFISAMLILLAARDVVIKKNKKWYRCITREGWALFLITLLYCWVSIDKIIANNISKSNDKQEEKKDLNHAVGLLENSVESAFEKHNAVFNPVTQTVYLKSPKTQDKDKPTVYIEECVFSNIKYGSILDTIPYQIIFKNSSLTIDAKGININAYAYVPYDANIKKHKLEIFKNGFIAKQGMETYYNFVLHIHNAIIDTNYIYVTGTYNQRKDKFDEVIMCDLKNSRAFLAGEGMKERIKKKIIHLKEVVDGG